MDTQTLASPAREPMLAALAATCTRTRGQAGVTRAQIAAAASLSVRTVERFEAAEAWPRGRRADHLAGDHLVDAYAAAGDVPSLDLWRSAIDRLRRNV